MSVTVERTEDAQFPIDVGLSDGWHHLTEKAAIELRNKLNEVIAPASSTLDAGGSFQDCIEEALPIMEDKITRIVEWLEKNQPDVFKRGLWDAINGKPNDGGEH